MSLSRIAVLERQRDQEAQKFLACVSVIRVIHPWSRRYCDGRMTYAASEHNQATRTAIALGIALPTPDGTPWARDGMGRNFDGLTDEEAALGCLPVLYQTAQDRQEAEDTIARLRQRLEEAEEEIRGLKHPRNPDEQKGWIPR